jgi:hypothetical protein
VNQANSPPDAAEKLHIDDGCVGLDALRAKLLEDGVRQLPQLGVVLVHRQRRCGGGSACQGGIRGRIAFRCASDLCWLRTRLWPSSIALTLFDPAVMLDLFAHSSAASLRLKWTMVNTLT